MKSFFAGIALLAPLTACGVEPDDIVSDDASATARVYASPPSNKPFFNGCRVILPSGEPAEYSIRCYGNPVISKTFYMTPYGQKRNGDAFNSEGRKRSHTFNFGGSNSRSFPTTVEPGEDLFNIELEIP